MGKLGVAVLGATGAVGQKFVRLLADHPWFQVTELVASERRAGQRYADSVSWKQETELPREAGEIPLKSLSDPLESRLLFSGLDSSVAGEAESAYAAAGHLVVSNARNHRMDPDVPLVIPEINADHLSLLRSQKTWDSGGGIVTNSNCSTMFLTMALAPLHHSFGVQAVQVTTMQAISGAGYPGVPSMDILGNVIPFISGEEDKLETEPRKILGTLSGSDIAHAGFGVSATCTRVPVFDGHLESVSVLLRDDTAPQEAEEAMRAWRGPEAMTALPSAPESPLEVMTEPDRPQPARDVWRQSGMAAQVGRIRPCPLQTLRFVVLGHNTVRGAAGAAILNAESMVAMDLLRVP